MKKVVDIHGSPWYDIKVADGDRTAQEMSVVQISSKKWKKCLTDKMSYDNIIKLSLVRARQKTTAEHWQLNNKTTLKILRDFQYLLKKIQRTFFYIEQ